MLQRLASCIAITVLTVSCAQSDPGITTAVKSRLAADDTVKAYQIDVDTSNRVVTLSGAVETAAAKEQAIRLARQTDGVQDVVDRITVNAAAAPTTGDLREGAETAGREARETAGTAADRAGEAVTDAALTSAVKGKFLADTSVAGLNIDVDTANGIVTLTGRVASQAEADRALSLARQTDGVKSVVNNLRIGG